jgi:hypothetical protein
MAGPGSSAAQRLAVLAGAAVAWLCGAYVIVLSIGLATLPSPDRPIQDPWFTLMELLILAIAPAMVAWAVALHAGAPAETKALALAAAAFMSMSAAVTCVVHFSILTLARAPAFAGEPWARQVFAFQWPSIVYALDILAWDVFFAFGALFAAMALEGGGRRLAAVRALLFAAAALAFLGLAGVPLADMRVRNLGIVGYAVLFPIAAGLLAEPVWRAGQPPGPTPPNS